MQEINLESNYPVINYNPVNLSHPSLEARIEETRSLRELQTAINEASIVAETDAQGRITKVNDKFCEISKYSREELLGQNHRLLNSSLHPPEFFKNLWKDISSGHVWKGEIRNRAKDGSFYWVDTTIVPFYNSEGKIQKYISIRHPISKVKDLESQLVNQIEVADHALQSSKLKTQFISEAI